MQTVSRLKTRLKSPRRNSCLPALSATQSVLWMQQPSALTQGCPERANTRAQVSIALHFCLALFAFLRLSSFVRSEQTSQKLGIETEMVYVFYVLAMRFHL